MEYLVDVLYSGFYAFEAITERDINKVICGHCGIIGKVYYGDGNEKNCCTNKDVSFLPIFEQNTIIVHKFKNKNIQKGNFKFFMAFK